MPEWITYRLSDLLLFSPRTYYRMFELYHQQTWPAHAVIVAFAVILVVMLRREPKARGPAVAGVLALSWIWVAIAFHLQRYATINWAARYFAVAFIVQGILLLWHGVIRGRLPLRQSALQSSRIFPSLLFLALVIEAIAGLVGGRTWEQLEFPGLTPDATAIATLLVLCLPALRAPRVLLVFPILWCAVGGATLWALGSAEAWVVLIAGVIGVIATFRIQPATAPAI